MTSLARLRAYAGSVHQYKVLDSFVTNLKDVDPRSTVEVNWSYCQNNTQRFQSLFISPGPVKNKIGHVMPVFSCDGASLSNSHLNGCLLLFTGMDAERRLVLFAVGICKSESKDSWTWFLGKCVEAHEELKQLQGVLISDRDKGLNAVNLNDIMPNMEHVFCCKHIERNLRARFKGFPTSASYQFWKAVRSTSIQEFNDTMEMFSSLHNEAYMYINKLEPSQWTSVFVCIHDMGVIHLTLVNRLIMYSKKRELRLSWIYCTIS